MKDKIKKSKNLTVKVRTVDSVLEFEMEKNAIGRELFNQVAKTIGLREFWYFGIQYIDKDKEPTFLKLKKKISSIVFAPGHENNFQFLVRFYPENVEEELIQTCTIKLFYKQVKNDIRSGKIFCPSDTAVLLESYALVSAFGSYDPKTCPKTLPISDLIPNRDQYNRTDEQWYENIISYYKDHKDMSREEGMVQYLQVAQDLEMYGVEKFDVKNKKQTPLVLGVDALGLSIYDRSDSLDPKIGFSWSEICKLSYRDNKFYIQPVSKSDKKFFFLVHDHKTCKRILDLCTGNHSLYMRRRRPDSIEVQQMKVEAREEQKIRDTDRQRLKEERLLRMEAEQEMQELQAQMSQKESDLKIINEKMEAYKNKVAELKSLLAQEQKAREELQISQDRLASMNRKLKEETQATVEERNRLQAERDAVQLEVEKQKSLMASKEAEKIKAEEELRKMQEENKPRANGSGDEISQDGDSDAKDLEVNVSAVRIEESRKTEIAKNQSLQKKLGELKSELNAVRDVSRMRDIDRKHDYNVRQGNDKYKTLSNIRQGNTMARVEQFESM